MPEFEEMKPTPIESEADRQAAWERRQAENPWHPFTGNAPHLDTDEYREWQRKRLEEWQREREREQDESVKRIQRGLRTVNMIAWACVGMLTIILLAWSCDGPSPVHVIDDPDHYSRR